MQRRNAQTQGCRPQLRNIRKSKWWHSKIICIPVQEGDKYPVSGSSSPALQNTNMQNYWESCEIDCVGHFSRNDHWIIFPKRKMDYNICLFHKTFFSLTFGRQSRASYGADFNRTWDEVHVEKTVCFWLPNWWSTWSTISVSASILEIFGFHSVFEIPMTALELQSVVARSQMGQKSNKEHQ
jgi:hypothetical protein